MTNCLTRRTFVQCLAAPLAQAAVKPRAELKLRPFDYTGVRLGDGMLKSQFQYARDFYFNMPDDSLLLGFRSRAGLASPGKPLSGWYGGAASSQAQLWWSKGDTFNAFGQYIGGMARLARAGNDQPLLDKAANLIEEWAKTIEPDGYFFYSRHPFTPHYIYEKTVGGLADLYEFGGNKQAIAGLERITAWAEKNLDRSRKTPLDGVDFSANGQEWYTLPENLYRGYQLTGDERYQKFADLWRYPAYWGMFNGASEPKPYRFHAYSHVNTLSSAARTYEVTGDPQYLNTIRNAYDWLQRTQVYATGGFGPGEQLQPPDGSLGAALEHNQNTFETVCGSWAIFKLSRYLMQYTGEAKYGDWIEKAIYNGIGASLPIEKDGRNFYYSDYRLGGGRKIFHPDWRWSCCSGTYPLAIADYHNVIYFQDGGGVYVNLFVPSEVTWRDVRIAQETRFPDESSSTLTVHAASPAPFALRIRIPGWCEGASISVNGTRQRATFQSGSWATLQRTWKDGDQVKLDLPMRLAYVPVDPQHPRRVALVYGPVVLVRTQPGRLSAPPLQRPGESLEFRAPRRNQETFVPFYRLKFDESYEMYFDQEA